MKTLAGLFIISLWLCGASLAQTIKGKITDSIGAAIAGSSVNLKNASGATTIVAYTFSDVNGDYALALPVGVAIDNLVIEVRSLGYKNEGKSIESIDVPLNFILQPSTTELQTVDIKSSRPVLRVVGDTLSYKVSDFANPQDRTIGEVIKKLPGITIASNGTISYNNKPISALYIGGDNLLGGKYNIATNSIPQVAVDKVQVIQNDQPVKVLRNRVMSDDVALNLQIKKGAKLHIMGQESIGVGVPGKYDVDLSAMLFKDKYKTLNYLKGNNVGYDVKQDLEEHNINEDHQTSAPLLSLGNVSTPQLQLNRYFFNRSGVISLNNLVNVKKDEQLTVNAYYLHDTQKQNYAQQTTVFLPADTVSYNETQDNRSVPDLFNAEFTLKINRDNYYLNNILVTGLKKTNTYSGLKTNNVEVSQVLQDNTSNFSNEFNLIKALSSANIIQFYSYVSHSDLPQYLTIGSGLNTSFFNKVPPYAKLIQKINIQGWYTNNYLSFKMPTGAVTQSYNTGFSLQSQQLTSGLYAINDKRNAQLLSDSASNRLNWTKRKLYAEAAYDLPGETFKAHLSVPITLQQINYADRNLSRFFFNPQLKAQYNVSLENYLDLNYSYRNEFGTIEDVYTGYMLTNYRTLSANSGGLIEQRTHQAGVGFNYRKALTLFFWNINAMYSHTESNNIAAVLLTNNLQRSVVLPYPNATDSWFFKGYISKYIFVLNTTLNCALQWRNSSLVQLQNGVLLPFNTSANTMSIGTDTRITDQLNVSYKTALTQTAARSRAEVSVNQVAQLFQQFNINYSPVQVLRFNLSAEHYLTRQNGNPDLKCFFADAYVRYRLTKWKADLELSAVNMLNVKTYNALYLSANSVIRNSYTLPGRIAMVKVMFNF